MNTSYITDLFPRELLVEMVEGGYIRAHSHRHLHLVGLNYTDKAAYERMWNPATLACRGLIYDSTTEEIVARPFPKFFNHDEPDAEYDATLPCVVIDKIDGSLGICYPTPDGPAIATRGSFTSDQALHATEVLRARYPEWRPPTGWTALFEIVYPANRIVVDYGDLDDLVLLGYIGNTYGTFVPNPGGWPGPRAEAFEYYTLAAALLAPPRPGKEGFVVHFSDGARVKIKQEDYVRLHRIMTGFTARLVWKYLAVGACPEYRLKHLARTLHMDVEEVARIRAAGNQWASEIEDIAPAEFLGWFHETRWRLSWAAMDVEVEVYSVLESLSDLDRKAFAAAIADHRYRGMVFSALDDLDIRAAAWMAVRPEHELPFSSGGE